MPLIDSIDPVDFHYINGGIGCKLGFLWKMMEHAFEPHQEEKRKEIMKNRIKEKEIEDEKIIIENEYKNKNNKYEEAYSLSDIAYTFSPTMPGGLFAANKNFFFSIGAYDEGFKHWGTENLEFSFRLWMCGGRLICAPCSRVFHIFRSGGVGYSSPVDSVVINKMRTLLWMDEYADLAWRVIGEPRVDYGKNSLEERRKFKEKNCKSFRWFMENVFPESDVKYLSDVPYLGKLKNIGSSLCLDTSGSDTPNHQISVQQCHGGRTQQFMYFKNLKQIKPVGNDETCLESPDNFKWCHIVISQQWEYTEHKMLKNEDKCLSVENKELQMSICDPNNTFLIWEWDKYNPPNNFVFPKIPVFRNTFP